MAELVFSYAPNRTTSGIISVVTDTFNGTTWHVVASDGTGYASIAALLAAGKTLFPLLDRGMFLQSLLCRSVATGGGADGSAFYVMYNQATAPTDATGEEVSGSGQTVVLAPGRPYNVWVRKTVATDLAELIGAF